MGERAHYRHLFEDNNVLNSICEKVIIPNMEFRREFYIYKFQIKGTNKYVLASDQELFEDNPEEYIRRDIEGSDIDTRRRAACDLVNTLSQNFEQRIMEIFGQYLQVKSLLKKCQLRKKFIINLLGHVDQVSRKSTAKLA